MRAYVDANATYPVDPDHYDRVAALLKASDGNPSSIHGSGRNAKVALEKARAHVARLIGATGPEVVFTSGATEANNMAIQGVIGARADGAPARVLLSSVEHASVWETVEALRERGMCEPDLVPVNAAGAVDPEAVLARVTPSTRLVCLVHGNNETGALTDIARVAALLKAQAPGIHLHVDAVQTLGKLDLGWLHASGVGSAALSAHKIGGFKGVGALYLRSGVRLRPLLLGGGQERGRRPGTENLPGILSFGLVAEALAAGYAARAAAMTVLRDEWLRLLATVPGAHVHGDPRHGLPNTVSFHLDGVPGEDLLLNFDLAGIQASSGSACSSGVARPSRILKAMGYDDWVALNTVRFSFPHTLDPAVLPAILDILRQVAARSRRG